MKEEEWKKLKNWELQYEITKDGKVRNIKNKRHLAIHTTKSGYRMVYLRDTYEKKNKGRFIHRLVMQTYEPNLRGLKEVNHKDFDKTNNHLDNLEWVDKRANVDHAVRGGRYSWSRNPGPEVEGYAWRVMNGKRELVKVLSSQ